jgi:hypothetical protein
MIKSPRVLDLALCGLLILVPFFVACAAVDEKRQDIVVLVDGVAPPVGGVNFGNASIMLGQFVNKVVTVKNAGDKDLLISGAITISSTGSNGDEFTVIGSLPATIAGGAQAQVTLRFDPTDGVYGAYDDRRETVTIANNDPDEGSYSFEVYGVGVS